MNLRVVFDLSDDDLRHFQLIMREARQASAAARPEDIVAAAQGLLDEAATRRIPEFIRTRFDALKTMIDMLSDHEWRLPEEDAARVLNALAYFAEPEDLIPDHIPGLGFLDDAIMIELVVRELKYELEAYKDFCAFRAGSRSGLKARTTDITRDDWLAARRADLQEKMHRRRKGRDSKTVKPRLKLF
ncbi:MAG: YkvA family protein [Gammaproteobacteria bacterium]|nr:YkvA family protein [Gammaproteobacteria bacterium]MDH4255680.1 YkvA family protein [Gammaproteobacteria bacterium]MDH5308711.1 YkvA family protein [Gammaproteobacteria bacterium]